MEPMQTVRIGRHDIAFFDDGSGQPLVLLPDSRATQDDGEDSATTTPSQGVA